jgi:hypothetical protein
MSQCPRPDLALHLTNRRAAAHHPRILPAALQANAGVRAHSIIQVMKALHIAFAFVALGTSACGLFGPALPPDSVFAQRLVRERRGLEQLADMALRDAASSRGEIDVRPDFAQAPGLTESRIADYRRRIEQLDLPFGVFTDSGRAVFQLAIGSGGIGGKMNVKGLMYVPTGQLRSDTAELGDRCGGYRRYLTRRVDAHWYIYRYCS